LEEESTGTQQRQALEYIQAKLANMSTQDEVDELDSMLNALLL
jgi:hypothetical protein